MNLLKRKVVKLLIDKKPVKIDDQEKTLEYISTNHADAMKSGNYSYFKDGNKNLPIWSDGRTLYKITFSKTKTLFNLGYIFIPFSYSMSFIS